MRHLLRWAQGVNARGPCVIFASVLLAACTAMAPPSLPHRLYDGGPRPLETIAVIEHSEHDYVVGGWRAELEAVNGVAVNPSRVEVLPGRHSLRIGGTICIAGVCSGTVPANLSFVAEAGRRYRVDCDYWLSEMVVRDLHDDRIVARAVCSDGACTPAE